MGDRQLLFLVFTLTVGFLSVIDCKEKLSIKLPKRHRKGKEPYKVGAFKANWYKAEETCREMKMRLATIKGVQASERIAETIEAATDDMSSAVVGQFWTSGNDLAELGSFYWMATGEEIKRYTNWRRGAPSKEERSYLNWETSPHCIYLLKQKRAYVWDYGPCSQKRYFICEHYERR